MIEDSGYPCDHGRKCLVECPPCTERTERQNKWRSIGRPRLRVIEGDAAQSTRRFREQLEELKSAVAAGQVEGEAER